MVVTFKGNVSAYSQLMSIKIRITGPTGIVNEINTPLMVGGTYQISFTAGVAGTYSAFSTIPEDVTYSAATSPTIQFQVTSAKTPRTITLTAL